MGKRKTTDGLSTNELFKVSICFIIGLIVFAATLFGFIYWLDLANVPNWVRYILGLPIFALSVFAGWSIWRQSLQQFNVDIDD